MTEPRRMVLAVTGAGGTRLTGAFLRKLVADDRVSHVDLIVSANARKVIGFEMGVNEDADPIQSLNRGPSDKITLYDPDRDVDARLSSGTSQYWGMIVLPCAVGAAARIAHGTANSLLERAADICLKHKRPLILAIRESPLNLIQLRNMVQLTEAGATIYPTSPSYYTVPETLEEMDAGFVTRLLTFIGLDQPETIEWDPEKARRR